MEAAWRHTDTLIFQSRYQEILLLVQDDPLEDLMRVRDWRLVDSISLCKAGLDQARGGVKLSALNDDDWPASLQAIGSCCGFVSKVNSDAGWGRHRGVWRLCSCLC